MNIVHGSSFDFFSPSMSHRDSGIAFKHLAHGDDDSAENYILTLGRQRAFYSPRHRHNFDQFRYAVKGDFDLGPNLLLREGQVAYHPEGAYYGPQNDGPEERLLLALQFGGASGQGYASFARPPLKKANEELAQIGRFEGGKYIGPDGNSKDGYEALWEHLNGRKLEYPKARYHTPVLMDPEAFAWMPVKDEAGNGNRGGDVRAWKKSLGVFSEREVRVEMFKLVSGGSIQVGGQEANYLIYVTKGTGLAGGQVLSAESAITLTGTTGQFTSESDEFEALCFVLPHLPEAL